ncbi:MAG: hypothetical protein ABSD57_11230 [Verrucomicrobiota bacterium]|jgi:hypothetical protein
MKAALLFVLLSVSAVVAGESTKDGFVPIAKFEVSSPVPGWYAPWRDPKDQTKWYAGQLILITNASFRYGTFSDVVGVPRPDYSGPLKVFADHIYLDHPGVPYPYRVAGKADGIPVLVTWEGYEQWKKSGKVFELNILYFWKDDAKEANKTVQRTGASRSAQETNRTSSAAGSRR